MKQVIIIRVRKRTLWILLFVFLAIVGCVLFWYVGETKRAKELRLEIKKGEKELVKKVREDAMRQHIKHVDEGIDYHKYCGICNSDWGK